VTARSRLCESITKQCNNENNFSVNRLVITAISFWLLDRINYCWVLWAK